MQFSEVIGQEPLKRQLAEMVYQNRLSHALLFLGREGSGALPLALAFSQFVVCTGRSGTPQPPSLFGTEPEQPAATPATSGPLDSCGTCPSCLKAKKLIHPDIHYTYPVVTKKPGDKPISTDYIKEWREFVQQFPYGNTYDWLQFIGAENKQGNITAAECNDIIRKLSLKSYEGRYKILILWMPEYLDKEGNKLLKLIEEPPEDTLFILVAEHESQVLPTLLSRCQIIKIPSLETRELSQALVERSGLNTEQAQSLAAIAEGNYREALHLIQHADDDWQALLRDWLNSMLKSGPAAQVKWVEEIAKLGREKQKQFLRYFNHLLEQAIRLRAMGDPAASGHLITANELDFAERLNKIADLAQQEALIGEIDRASYYIERNANAKMLFMALTLKCYHIIANKSVLLNP